MRQPVDMSHIRPELRTCRVCGESKTLGQYCGSRAICRQCENTARQARREREQKGKEV